MYLYFTRSNHIEFNLLPPPPVMPEVKTTRNVDQVQALHLSPGQQINAAMLSTDSPDSLTRLNTYILATSPLFTKELGSSVGGPINFTNKIGVSVRTHD